MAQLFNNRSFFLCLVVVVIIFGSFANSASAFDRDVENVDVSGNLNVSSYHSTSSSIIATVPSGSDVIDYCEIWSDSGCAYTDPDVGTGNYEGAKFYYPNFSLGKYSEASYGWMAYQPRFGTGERYISSSPSVKVIKSTGTPKTYTNSCALTGPSTQVFAYDTTLSHPYDDDYVVVQDCSVNSWIVNSPDYNSDKHYLNGWHLNGN
jgi:hypothetical protein